MFNNSAMQHRGMAKTTHPPPPLRPTADWPPPPAKTPTPAELKPPPARQRSQADEVLIARRKAKMRDLIAREIGGSVSLARKAGCAQSYMNHLSLPGYPFGQQAARNLEKRLGLPHMYFDQPMLADGQAKSATPVPVQQWGDLGRFAPQPDAPAVMVPWEVSPRAVAALWATTHNPVMPSDWHAVIDPDSSVRDGDIVACWLPGSREATLRHVQRDGRRKLLYPLDQRHPSVDEWDENVMVVGPVIGVLRSFR